MSQQQEPFQPISPAILEALSPPPAPPLDLSPLFNNLDQPAPSHLGNLGLPPLHLLHPDGVQHLLGTTSAPGTAAA